MFIMSLALGGLGSSLSETHPHNLHLSTLHLALEMKAQEGEALHPKPQFYGRKLDLEAQRMPLHSATASGHIGPVMLHSPTYRPNAAITEHRVVSQAHPGAHMAR